MYLPEDIVLMVSVLNTYLRDRYDDLESLCDDLDLSIDEINNKLQTNNYEYIKEINQIKER